MWQACVRAHCIYMCWHPCTLSRPTSAPASRLRPQEVDLAAKSLGCSATTLKLACRAVGIKRWPQRKLASLEHLAK